ncbi:MAG: alkaline phosphatase D family protein [Burkholderiales bacterium]|nr:alkaline phosphatase D family protein [Burkholderiales bacterium]
MSAATASNDDGGAAADAAPPRGRIAHWASELWQDPLLRGRTWDVVIVGSGYGGSAAAMTLAGREVWDEKKGEWRPMTVCVLERGREYLPGEFPSRFSDLPGHLRLTRGAAVSELQEGLFDLRLGEDVMALLGNGLGGGSLINAGVLLAPEPGQVQGEAGRTLRKLHDGGWFDRARRELGALVRDEHGGEVENTIELHPDLKGRPLPKSLALARMATLGARHRNVPISVAMSRRANSADTLLEACTLCGDCMTGCNVGAKDSLDTNWLVSASEAGAQIFTGASVLSLRAADPRKTDDEAGDGARWVLRVAHTDPRLQRREEKLLPLKARQVILAAGTLGSTEILLRSRTDKLVFSPLLGSRFSCNGDSINALHGLPEPTRGNADEEEPLQGRRVGPTITGSVSVPAQEGREGGREEGRRAFEVQEFAVPAPLRRLLHETVTTAYVLDGLPEADRSMHGGEKASDADPLAVNADAMARSLVIGTIGHDEARGVLHLDAPRNGPDGTPQQGTLQMRWPDARYGAQVEQAHVTLRAMHEKMREAARQAGRSDHSTLLANPMWRLLPPALEALIAQPRGPVWTVHPLGGCAVGLGPGDGVVDEFGRVFDGAGGGVTAGGADVRRHGGLAVLDGSVFGASLGVNPALSIAAFALRAAEMLAGSDGLSRRKKAPDAEAAQSVQAQAQAQARRGRPRRPIAPEPLPYGPGAMPQTEMQLIERLRGTAWLHCGFTLPRPFVLELTLAYEEVPVRSMMSTLGCTMDAPACLREVRTGSQDARVEVQRLRLYDPREWDALDLRVKPEHQRAAKALAEVVVAGKLRFLHREASDPLRRRLRAAWAWLLNRGLRDMWQAAADARRAPAVGPDGKPLRPPGLLARARDLWRMASRAGEVRRFDYDLEVIEVVRDVMRDDRLRPLRLFAPGQRIAGHKRLTYNRRGNPWQQLTRMTLTQFPGLLPGTQPVLELDTRFLAGQGVPLLRITGQRDHASALADMGSLVLYLARVVLSTHLWTFRLPDHAPRREPDRLPGPIAGLPAPQVAELVVGTVRNGGEKNGGERNGGERNGGEKVKVRLTRYARPLSGKPALVLLHGYSVSGNTFTHESLAPSAAEYFWRRGRDVWVVDLRTSSGLPTCTLPWSMEQVALVDIPAALMHVRQATGRPVDVLAHCIGCAMLGMALLADPRDVRSGDTELGVDDWLTSEHLGTLAAFNGTRPAGGPHPSVGRIVLSQKGPLLRYTDDNVMRAFLMQTLRRWLLADDYQFRPPARPGLVDQLLDRLLASMPYPRRDWQVENPLWPCKRTPWTATRHRMDALYGRDFSAWNMREATLRAIDDLFGAIHLDTVAQTIHFSRFEAITNQRGRGEFVTRKRLRERWAGIPTLAIHGGENGLADVTTQTLLHEQLGEAGVPIRSLRFAGMGHQDTLIGLGSPQVFAAIEAFLLDSTGEASVPVAPAEGPPLKGEPAPRPAPAPGAEGTPLLPDPTTGAPIPLTANLLSVGAAPAKAEPEAIQHRGSAARSFVLEEPWAGPRIDMPDLPWGDVQVAALSRPDQGRARLALVPARRIAAVPGAARYEVLDLPAAVNCGDAARSGFWLTAVPPLAHAWPQGAAATGEPGWLALLLYERDETAGARASVAAPAPPAAVVGKAAASGVAAAATAAPPSGGVLLPRVGFSARLRQLFGGGWQTVARSASRPDLDRSSATPTTPTTPASPDSSPACDAAELIDLGGRWLRATPEHEHATAFIALADLQRAQALLGGGSGPPSSADAGAAAHSPWFALASCQYPAGLLDGLVARQSLDLLAARAASPANAVRFALLVGDQIYADATAGLADPVRRDELFEQPNERALRAPGMRQVLRCLPVAALPDDHEIADNWEPLAARFAPPAKVDAKRELPTWERTREHGLAAFWRYQRMSPLDRLGRPGLPAADQAFEWGGLPVYLLDTRSARQRRGSRVPEHERHLVDEAQRESLENWLLRHQARPKIVATSALLLPRRWTSQDKHRASARSDAWDGYPASLSWLLDFLLASQVRHTIFVSGDEHHSLVCEALLRSPLDGGPQPVRLTSVHSSALYAPYPFANGRRANFGDEAFDTLSGRTRVSITMTTFAPPGDGFATLQVLNPPGGTPRLRLRFVKAGAGAGPDFEVPELAL